MAKQNRYVRCCSALSVPLKFASAVANSGGPDSTCLLFLTHRLLSTSKQTGLPQSVISLTLDHDLQLSSSKMAERCAESATSMGVEHLTSVIPWSQPPFPDRPVDAGSFESIARTARYHVLFAAMSRMGAKVIAFGHHADDQVETSLMRLARGTTELGAGGMRPCRRWGMGLGRNETSLGWSGLEGMSRWILRPLIEFSKVSLFSSVHSTVPDSTRTEFLQHVESTI
jgi:tRNA(Ile)-lysidine synthase